MTTFAGSADLSRLALNLQQAAKKAPDLAEKVLDAASEQIAERMKELAPKKTGRLYMSIVVIKQPKTRVIGPQGVDYAGYQEYGTGTRGERGGSAYEIKPVRAERLVFKVNGQFISTKRVVHPGIPAHPYVRPALAEYIGSIADDMARQAADLTLSGKLGK